MGRYRVRVTYLTGVQHLEGRWPGLEPAEEYARTAVEDPCPKAEVLDPGNHVASVWDRARLATCQAESLPEKR